MVHVNQIWDTGGVDLTHVGTDLLGGTQARVLRSLSRLENGASGRQIARLAGDESKTTVYRYLAKLHEIGLLTKTVTPAAILYRLNRDHVFWGPISAMLSALTQVNEEIVDFVKSELGPTARVAAFGSVARGDSGLASDYDLLLIVPDETGAEVRSRATQELRDLIEKRTGNQAQIIDVSERELRNLVAHNSPLVDEWRRTARPLDGRGLVAHLRQEQ